MVVSPYVELQQYFFGGKVCGTQTENTQMPKRERRGFLVSGNHVERKRKKRTTAEVMWISKGRQDPLPVEVKRYFSGEGHTEHKRRLPTVAVREMRQEGR